jgi:glycosyltransferase involved in cell wall biosynthesis
MSSVDLRGLRAERLRLMNGVEQTPATRRAGRRLRVALVGHLCSPTEGSEPGLTWNWAKHLSRHVDVCLFSFPRYRQQVEAHLALEPCEGLSIEWVDTAGLKDPWRPEESERGVRAHYRLWQRRVAERVEVLRRQRPFDLVHHVSWGSLHRPPPVSRCGLPFVWGPLGGGQSWPKAFDEYLGGWGALERARRCAVALTPWLRNVRSTARGAALVFATNRETRDLLHRLGARRVEVSFDNGIRRSFLADRPRAPGEAGKLTVLWGGRCEPRKGLALAVEAMARVQQAGVRLLVAGDGPTLTGCQDLARRLGVAHRVTFLGRVPWQTMAELFAAADALLFTSLRDSTGSVVVEAMAAALPVITLDHQGMAHLVADEAGVKVPVTTPPQAVERIAAAMDQLAADPTQRQQLGAGALAAARQYAWDERAVWMAGRYEELMRAHRSV